MLLYPESSPFKCNPQDRRKDAKRTCDVFYQVREAIWRNCATVVVWEFRPPSTVMI